MACWSQSAERHPTGGRWLPPSGDGAKDKDEDEDEDAGGRIMLVESSSIILGVVAHGQFEGGSRAWAFAWARKVPKSWQHLHVLYARYAIYGYISCIYTVCVPFAMCSHRRINTVTVRQRESCIFYYVFRIKYGCCNICIVSLPFLWYNPAAPPGPWQNPIYLILMSLQTANVLSLILRLPLHWTVCTFRQCCI